VRTPPSALSFHRSRHNGPTQRGHSWLDPEPNDDSVTLEFYVQGDAETKRKALKNVSGIFVVPPVKKSA
jgi:hypothetical protein